MLSFVPLGISAYDGKQEKGSIKFTIDIEDNDADKLLIQVRNGANVIYEEQFTDGSMLKVGSHPWYWDGFDSNGILDTKMLTDSTNLNLLSKVWLDDEVEFETVDFKANYSEVKWVDVVIDKNIKRIDVTLRVNLTDGGAKGLNNWNDIPKKELIAGKDPIKIRTKRKSFEDLEELAKDGINYHWGRNQNHFSAKNVDINGDKYELFVNTINSKTNAMDDVELIYNTNRNWMRSGNPGTVDDPISFIGNIVSREAICYNVGYIKSSHWRYQIDSNEDINFKETSAHEIGHTILKSYGGTFYSYGHKGSVNTITQSESSDAKKYPRSGEIDIMPYYTDFVPYRERKRMVAAERDCISLLWLTKIKLQ